MTNTSRKLLTRDAFREGVFARDGHKCVLCEEPAQDAHHILERRLFEDGGYYLDNGASVCGPCHLLCERTDVSVQEIRESAGITKPIIPEHLYDDQVYDKWGNIALGGGKWLRGELFYDESVQKVIAWKLSQFVTYVKYPRTHHLPWSENIHDDDRALKDTSIFKGREIVVTEKMDGENTTMYRDYIHARSIDSKNHESRNWVKNFWSQISGDIPDGWRICGENLFAKHSIEYTSLDSYFLGFSAWRNDNICCSWDETREWFDLLGIRPVKTLYRGPFEGFRHSAVWNDREYDASEGYVLRVTDAFPYGAFRQSVAKFVRKNHVQTVKHWMHGQRMEVNKLVSTD
jgi:hypothetical protein